MHDIDSIVKNMRKDIVRLTYAAGKKGAHIGSSLSLVEILAVLFSESFDFGKDKFVLSKGHGGLGYYAALYGANQITKEQLDTFETNGGDFPGQPSRQIENGILYSSGSLGLGLSYAVGHAWSMKLHGMDGRVVAVLGDGELNEGSVWEAAMLAKQQNLSNLLAIVDWNQMQSDGESRRILALDLEKIWTAFGWNVVVCDGHSIKELRAAYAETEEEVPKVILARTIKGKGVSFMENNKNWHHNHLTEKQYKQAMEELEKINGV